jgi:hypothetical protein
MVFKNTASLILIAIATSGCAKLWPYKSDFDCPIEEGLKCRSLYEVSKMADEGRFGTQSERFKEKLQEKLEEDERLESIRKTKQEKIKKRKARMNARAKGKTKTKTNKRGCCRV